MLQCFEGIKHLGASLLQCCDLDRQPRGLDDPEILARETVCMLLERHINISYIIYVYLCMCVCIFGFGILNSCHESMVNETILVSYIFVPSPG